MSVEVRTLRQGRTKLQRLGYPDIDFAGDPPPPPPPAVATLMGMPDNGNPHGYTNWDVWRIYDLFNATDGAVNKGAKRIALTDGTTGAWVGLQASADRLRSHLMQFYGNTGAPSLNTTIYTDFANKNEFDKDGPPGSWLNFANTYELYEEVVADFDLATLWCDGTAQNARNNVTDDFLDAQASSGRHVYEMLVDSGGGYASSYYTPGRNNYPVMTASSYTGKSAPSAVVDPILAKCAPRGITRVACWEFGMPMLVDDPIGWPNEGNTTRNNTKRRDYVETYIHYWMQRCIDLGLEPVCFCYWDQQTGSGKGLPGNTNPDNRLVNDNSLITPNTATVIRNALTTFVPN